MQHKVGFRVDLANIDLDKLDSQFTSIKKMYHQVYKYEVPCCCSFLVMRLFCFVFFFLLVLTWYQYSNHFQIGYCSKTWWGSIMCVTILGHITTNENGVVKIGTTFGSLY